MKRITAIKVLSISEGEFNERLSRLDLSDLKTLDDLFIDLAD
jgi:hypothetical protein